MARYLNDEIDTNEIELFACNTGELYHTHLELAQREAPESSWVAHVCINVMPMYRRQVTQKAWAKPQTIAVAARRLKERYREHLTEF